MSRPDRKRTGYSLTLPRLRGRLTPEFRARPPRVARKDSIGRFLGGPPLQAA